MQGPEFLDVGQRQQIGTDAIRALFRPVWLQHLKV
jgi:hypothetical protein